MTTPKPTPDFFAWHVNRVQETLQVLHDLEPAHPQELSQVLHELKHSDWFWHLNSRYTDALQEAGDDENRAFEVFLVLLARIYTAGSLRRMSVIDKGRIGG